MGLLHKRAGGSKNIVLPSDTSVEHLSIDRDTSCEPQSTAATYEVLVGLEDVLGKRYQHYLDKYL
jgi:hypothetical protein